MNSIGIKGPEMPVLGTYMDEFSGNSGLKKRLCSSSRRPRGACCRIIHFTTVIRAGRGTPSTNESRPVCITLCKVSKRGVYLLHVYKKGISTSGLPS